MNKVECYRRAMLAVLRDETLEDDEILEVLEVLMEAQNIEKSTAAAWASYQVDQDPQELAE